MNAPPPKGGGFGVTDSSPVPSEARLKAPGPRPARRPPSRARLKPSGPRPAEATPRPPRGSPRYAPAPGSRCTPPPPRPSRSRCCSRSTPAPTGDGPRTPSADVRELLQHLVRRLPLQPLHQPADRHLRRDRHQQVHVVLAHVPLEDQHVRRPADLADQVPHAGPDRARPAPACGTSSPRPGAGGSRTRCGPHAGTPSMGPMIPPRQR